MVDYRKSYIPIQVLVGGILIGVTIFVVIFPFLLHHAVKSSF